jgi:hypothetical protein
MSSNTNENGQMADLEYGQDVAQQRNFSPALSFYHANSKGTGSVASFDITPATGDRDGAIFMKLAQQRSVATGSREQGNRQHATFDWANRIVVKLNFNDVCQMLSVLNGKETSINEGKGLYHDTRDWTTIINLSSQTEPVRGCFLDVSRRGKSNGDQATKIRILLNPHEAYGLGMVMEQSLSLLAFGVPREYRRAPAVDASQPAPAMHDEEDE